MKKFEDLTGRRFGKLVVIKQCGDYVSPKGHRKSQWLCRCDCGNEKKIVGKSLKNGKTKSCGHCNDLKQGDRFGKLVVIEQCEDYVSSKGLHSKQYLCKCECGNKVKIRGSNLRSGKTQSCGYCNNIMFVDPYDNKKYSGSIRNICLNCGFRYQTIIDRLKQGFTFEEAVKIKSNVLINKIYKIDFNGKYFEGNLKEICEYFNKAYNQVYKFMTYNRTLEWALEHANNIC